MIKRLAVIGGGIIGLATAWKAAQAGLAGEIVLLEKDETVGGHQSSHNSGVLHCGLYYQPGSLKAQLAVSGIREMVAFCREYAIPHEICGKIVMAVSEDEVPRLRNLEQRGTANGLTGLRWLGPEEIREIEPHAAGRAALRVPEEGIVDYPAVMQKMAQLLEARGHQIKTGMKVTRVEQRGTEQVIHTEGGSLEADYVINCAGLHCDRVARGSGFQPDCRIIPFRGDYWTLSEQGRRLVKHLIYPVPDPTLPFLGVHFTRMIRGGVEAGPNAVLAFKREGYRRTDFSLRDSWETLTFPGLYRFLKRYPGVTWNELKNSFSRKVFLGNLQRLIPEITMDDLSPHGGSGVRAQAIHRDGSLLMDFSIQQSPGQLHLLNAPSPGATASLAIGGYLLSRMAA
ncbi:MAG TPA: L-2-hydroxyglutarate oxidase [Verrucomicrobiales bacterium]|nr:L-2-hydroxyglutarate oxidase [Verrucomicrobiales bacterium]